MNQITLVNAALAAVTLAFTLSPATAEAQSRTQFGVITNAVVTTEVFLMTRSFWAVPAAILIHGIGYMASLKEPRIFDLWMMKASRCGRTKTHGLWKCNSYRP